MSVGNSSPFPPHFSVTPSQVRASLLETTQVWYVQSQYAPQLSAYTTQTFQLLFQTIQSEKKRSKHCRNSLENQNQEAIWAEKHGSADNEWKKHCGYSSWSSLNSGTLRKEVVLSGYLHVLFLLDFISQCDDKNWIIVFIKVISAPLFPVWVIYRVGGVYWILQRGFFGCGQSIVASFGPLQRNSGVGVLENALPLGNNTTTHNSLSPPTHLCTFWSVISGNRNLLSPAFLEATNRRMGLFGKRLRCQAEVGSHEAQSLFRRINFAVFPQLSHTNIHILKSLHLQKKKAW